MDWKEVLGWKEQEIDDLRYAAYSYIKQGIYDVALTLFEAIAALSPLSPYDLQTIGALHLQIGNGLKALEYLDRAIQADPTHAPTQLNRMKTLLMLGYKRQAFAEAASLELSDDPLIASAAKALLLAYHG